MTDYDAHSKSSPWVHCSSDKRHPDFNGLIGDLAAECVVLDHRYLGSTQSAEALIRLPDGRVIHRVRQAETVDREVPSHVTKFLDLSL